MSKEIKNESEGSLFGFGIVMYGLGYLLIRHFKDFISLLANFSSNYIFEEYRSVATVKYIDTDIENKITAQARMLGSYLSVIPLVVGSIGILRWKFGSGVRQDVCVFMKDMKDLFSDCGFIFENAPTKLQYRKSPGIGLKILHLLDRPRNCFPSPHVIMTSYASLKTNELINRYSYEVGANPAMNSFLLKWSLRIIESCLLTKQHGLRDIAGGLAVVASKCPQFNRQDMNTIISLIFSDNSYGLPLDSAELVRKEIGSIYSELLVNIDSQKGDYRSALVGYVNSI